MFSVIQLLLVITCFGAINSFRLPPKKSYIKSLNSDYRVDFITKSLSAAHNNICSTEKKSNPIKKLFGTFRHQIASLLTIVALSVSLPSFANAKKYSSKSSGTTLTAVQRKSKQNKNVKEQVEDTLTHRVDSSLNQKLTKIGIAMAAGSVIISFFIDDGASKSQKKKKGGGIANIISL